MELAKTNVQCIEKFSEIQGALEKISSSKNDMEKFLMSGMVRKELLVLMDNKDIETLLMENQGKDGWFKTGQLKQSLEEGFYFVKLKGKWTIAEYAGSYNSNNYSFYISSEDLYFLDNELDIIGRRIDIEKEKDNSL